MKMEIDKDHEEMIVNFGALGYETRRMANILGFSHEKIRNEMDDPNSEYSQLYKKGQDLADYVIDLKLFEMAKTGDIKALEKLDTRKRMRI